MRTRRRKQVDSTPAVSKRAQFEELKEARLERLNAAMTEMARLSLPSEEEDALELAAKVEETITEAIENVRSHAAERRQRAEEIEELASALLREAGAYEVDGSQLDAVRVTAQRRASATDALEVRIGRAVAAGVPAREVDRMEALRDRRRSDAEAAAAEASILSSRVAEHARLIAEAEAARSQAAALRDEADRLETEGVEFVRQGEPEIALRLRAERDRERRLRVAPAPTAQRSSADDVMNGVVITTDAEGRLQGLALPLNP